MKLVERMVRRNITDTVATNRSDAVAVVNTSRGAVTMLRIMVATMVDVMMMMMMRRNMQFWLLLLSKMGMSLSRIGKMWTMTEIIEQSMLKQ